MKSNQTVVWLDHKEARIFPLEGGKLDEATVSAPKSHLHRHDKGGTPDANHPDGNNRFFQDVAQALDGANEILLLGPSTAKLQFFRYVHKQVHALEPKIVGMETVDHPTDGQIVAYARHYFESPTHAH